MASDSDQDDHIQGPAHAQAQCGYAGASAAPSTDAPIAAAAEGGADVSPPPPPPAPPAVERVPAGQHGDGGRVAKRVPAGQRGDGARVAEGSSPVDDAVVDRKGKKIVEYSSPAPTAPPGSPTVVKEALKRAVRLALDDPMIWRPGSRDTKAIYKFLKTKAMKESLWMRSISAFINCYIREATNYPVINLPVKLPCRMHFKCPHDIWPEAYRVQLNEHPRPCLDIFSYPFKKIRCDPCSLETLKLRMPDTNVLSPAAALALQNQHPSTEVAWFLDSGSSYHVTGDKSNLRKLTKVDEIVPETATSRHFRSEFMGNLRSSSMRVQGVYWQENFSMNVISLGLIEDCGCQIDIGDMLFFITDLETGAHVGHGSLDIDKMQYVISELKLQKGKVRSDSNGEDQATEKKKQKQKQKKKSKGKRKRESSNELMPDSEEIWVLDSGSLHHLTHSRHKFSNFHRMANRKVFLTTPMGEKILVTHQGKKKAKNFRLDNVYYAPQAYWNIASVPQLDLQGYKFCYKEGACRISWRLKQVGIAYRDAGNDLYYIQEFQEVSHKDKTSVVD